MYPLQNPLHGQYKGKTFLNPVDNLHHDPQKLHGKQAHQSTQIQPRNGDNSLHVLVFFQDLLHANRVNKDASLLVHALPPASLGQRSQLAATQSTTTSRSSSMVSLHSKHSQVRTGTDQPTLSSPVFPRDTYSWILRGEKQRIRRLTFLSFYDNVPITKIPLSQFLQVCFNIEKSQSLFVFIQRSRQNCNDLTVM